MQSKKIQDQDETAGFIKNMTRSQAFAIMRETVEANLSAKSTLTIRARRFDLKSSINIPKSTKLDAFVNASDSSQGCSQDLPQCHATMNRGTPSPRPISAFEDNQGS